MLHQHGPQGWLGEPRQGGRFARAAMACRPVARRWVVAVTAVRASNSAREREAEPGHGGAPRGGVGGAKPQHARPDQVAQPPAEGGRMDR